MLSRPCRRSTGDARQAPGRNRGSAIAHRPIDGGPSPGAAPTGRTPLSARCGAASLAGTNSYRGDRVREPVTLMQAELGDVRLDGDDALVRGDRVEAHGAEERASGPAAESTRRRWLRKPTRARPQRRPVEVGRQRIGPACLARRTCTRRGDACAPHVRLARPRDCRSEPQRLLPRRASGERVIARATQLQLASTSARSRPSGGTAPTPADPSTCQCAPTVQPLWFPDRAYTYRGRSRARRVGLA